jgi:hypothetical protein
MNQQHLIDNAIIETAFAPDAVPVERRGEIEEFVKRDLMKVVDEVFDKLDGNTGAADEVFRIDNLDLDLGEIPFAEYRQQMPRKLREQLMLALADRRPLTQAGQHGKPHSLPAPVDRGSAEQEQLFYFLRFGHLPWYSRLEGSEALETLLAEATDSNPARLVSFLHENAQRPEVMTRLEQQFGAPAVERVRRLLPPAAADTAESAQDIADLPARLVTALQSGDAGSIQASWMALRKGHPELLKDTLQRYGQQAVVRQRLVAALSSARFSDLLRLLEPVAHSRIKSLLGRVPGLENIFDESGSRQPDTQGVENPGSPDWQESITDRVEGRDDGAPGIPVESRSNVDPYRLHTKLRESVLAYLLVERSARFDEQQFIDSLLRQLANSASAEIPVESLAGVTRQLHKLAAQASAATTAREQGPDSPAPNQQETNAQGVIAVDAYRQYERLKLALSGPQASRQKDGPEPGLLADLRALRQGSPWLLMRLYRELQNSQASPALALEMSAIENLAVAFLAEITDLFVTFSGPPDAIPADGTISSPDEEVFPVAIPGLAEAIHDNAARSKDRQFYYAQVIRRLVWGELIDFDAIAASEKNRSSVTPQPVIDNLAGKDPFTAGRDEAILTDRAQAQPGVALSIEKAPPRLLLYAELLTTASYSAGISLSVQELERLKWRFVEAYLVETGNLFNEQYFTRQFVASLVRHAKLDDDFGFRWALIRGLQLNSLPSTSDTVRRITRWLADGSEIISGVGGDTGAIDDAGADREPGESGDGTTALEVIHITNAGLVLFAPYLPRLFERLGLTEEGQFKSRGAAERGVHCLQFLVNASSSSPEYQLVLNKLLCGVRPGRPIQRGIELGAAEVEQLEGLLQAIIGHWKAIGNTSIEGLRESFLQRDGRLQRDNNAWRLAVESRPFDMLLDQIPWSFATIKFPWMERVIYVEWR